jgi:hypothetical protein
MAVKTKRYFGEQDKNALLNNLGSWRQTCVAVCSKAPIGGEPYRLAEKLMGDIDMAVKSLTGNKEHFYLKANSTGSNNLKQQ